MKSCLCIGGPKDGQWVVVGDRFQRGDVYRVMIQPKLPAVINDEVAPPVEFTVDTFLYTIDVVRSEASEWWYMRPYDQPVSHAIALLFANYQPKHETT
jgi:hypothetical protein